MERHVLVLFPHPDDETMAVGGAIAHHAAAGSPITYACFTLGEMGRNMGRPFFATRESLPVIREKELREACKALGISELRLLGFRDKTLEFEDRQRLSDIIYDLLTELKPSLVITYYPGYCVHPDHEAIAAATVSAVRRLPDDARPVLQCQAFSQGHAEALGERDVVIDTSAVWERVYHAWRAHRSQTGAWVERMEQALAGGAAEREGAIRQLSQVGLYTLRV